MSSATASVLFLSKNSKKICRCGAEHYRQHNLCRACHALIQPVPNGGICTKCGKEHTNRHSWCKECFREYDRSRSSITNERARTKSKNPKSRLKAILATNSVDRSLLSFDTMWNRLVANDFRCEITGEHFVYESRHPKSMSIDRIDSKLPYIESNVRFVCLWVNLAMSNWGLETLKELIDGWYRSERKW